VHLSVAKSILVDAISLGRKVYVHARAGSSHTIFVMLMTSVALPTAAGAVRSLL
jgi:hypothetical protein